MSANGTRTIVWANGEDQFCLSKIGLLLDLEAKCNAPLGVIFGRLGTGTFGVNDVRETIRLGLMGGGMAPEQAMDAVKRHVDDNEHGLAPSVLVAYAVVEAVMIGVPEDPIEGKQKPAEAAKTGFTSKTDASDAPKSSRSARRSAGLPG
ncbi:MAG: gene transfer agent family protein [Rhizobiales bacterium]|nr:gene transfer agent family protein [Hyphomicrobiales bacterium]